jgi:hypothetical protein
MNESRRQPVEGCEVGDGFAVKVPLAPGEWSPVPNDQRPTLDELFGAMRHQRVARVLTLLAQDPARAGSVLAFGHDFRPAGSTEVVRIEIREGTSRADVMKVMQEAMALLIDHWDELVDARRIADVGRTLGEEGTGGYLAHVGEGAGE